MGERMSADLEMFVSEGRVSPGDFVTGVVTFNPQVRLRFLRVELARVELSRDRYVTIRRPCRARLSVNPALTSHPFLLQVPEDAVESFVVPHGSLQWVVSVQARPRLWRREKWSGRIVVGSKERLAVPDLPPGPSGKAPEGEASVRTAAPPDQSISARWLWSLLFFGLVLTVGSVMWEVHDAHHRTPPPLIGINVLGNALLFGFLIQAVWQLKGLHRLRKLPRWVWRGLLVAGAMLAFALSVMIGSFLVAMTGLLLILGIFTGSEKSPPE